MALYAAFDAASLSLNAADCPIGMLSELKVIGMTVDQAIDCVSRFLDDTMVTDVQQVRIVHGHGTGALRKGLQAFLKAHPLVEKHYPAPDNQGGGGATIVELND